MVVLLVVLGFVLCNPTEIKEREIWSWTWEVSKSPEISTNLEVGGPSKHVSKLEEQKICHPIT